jgi:serine/threonine protein kinase
MNDRHEGSAEVDNASPADPFAGRMRAAVIALAGNPGDSRTRSSLAAMLGYGPGAQKAFDGIVGKLAESHAIDRRAVVMLRALADRVRKLDAIDDRTMMLEALAADATPNDEDTVIRSSDSEGEETQADSSARGMPPGEGDTIDNRFELKTLVGVGGMALVFRALDRQMNRDVAVKILKDSFLDTPAVIDAFIQEAKRSATIDDPGVVRIVATGIHEDRPYTAMEFLNGTTLNRILKVRAGRPATWARTLDFVNAVGRSLAAAHAKGIVHCDLKPSNLFQLSDESWRVFDFGIAQEIEEAGKPTLSVAGDKKEIPTAPTIEALTPAYASPEQLRRLSPDARDDIFSLAVITYEMLTGLHPFDRLPADQARDRRLQPPRPEGLPNRAWKTLRRGLAFDRDTRPRSMISFLGGLGKPRPRWPIILVLLAIILGGAAAMFPDIARQVFRDLELSGRAGMAYLEDDARLIQSTVELKTSGGPLGQSVITLARPLIEGRIRELARVEAETPTEGLRRANRAVQAGQTLFPGDEAISQIAERPFHLLLLDLADRLGRDEALAPETLRDDVMLLQNSNPQAYLGVEDVIFDLILERLRELRDPQAAKALTKIGRELFPNEQWVEPKD